MDLNQNQSAIPPTPQMPFQQPEVQPKPNKKLLIVFVIMLILVLALAATFFVLNQKSKKLPEESVSQPQVSPTSVLSEEETELESIEVGIPEKDFQDLQTAVEQL